MCSLPDYTIQSMQSPVIHTIVYWDFFLLYKILKRKSLLVIGQSAFPPYTAKRASPTPDGRSEPTSEKMNVTRSTEEIAYQ